ncbi:MAG: hypothetical protein ACR2L2_04565 [Acidobacteriota bacterium]
MGTINTGRVILGGLLAGLVLNVGEFLFREIVVKQQQDASLQAMNLPSPGPYTIAIFVTLGFAVGIAMVWLYAAIRPRYGAGVKTAICAAMFVWVFAWAFPGLSQFVLGMFTRKLIVMTLAWGLVELTVASVAGAWLYRE